jgi:hypothetical protein
MKQVLLVIGAVVGAIALSVPTTNAAARGCSHGPHPARMTIRFLRIRNQPIGGRECYLTKGPIWDPFRVARPGYGVSMVIDGHDVTPVPGYGAHGPFYRLRLMKPGYLATIVWKHVKYTYRVAAKPFTARQCLSKRVNFLPARLAGTLSCVGYDKPVKHLPVETLYLRSCWPQYTREKYLYVRAKLIKTAPARP